VRESPVTSIAFIQPHNSHREDLDRTCQELPEIDLHSVRRDMFIAKNENAILSVRTSGD
jgi:hypothetical protein